MAYCALACALTAAVVCTAWGHSENVFALDQAVPNTKPIARPHILQAGGEQGLALTVYHDGTYLISVAGQDWLMSAPSFVKVNGKVRSTDDGTLRLQWTGRDFGTDRIGDWTSVNLGYDADGKNIVLSFRAYKGIPAIVFGQDFVDGANDTTTHDKDNVLSGFPGFKIGSTPAELGYLSYGYLFVGNMDRRLGRWDAKSFVIRDGRNGGPMTLFDQHGHAIFISPFDQFMSASVWHDKVGHGYYWGIMGGVERVPRGFSYHTIMYYGEGGINTAISGWGDVMRRYYNKQSHFRESDLTNNYLSYWSDNGAYYVNYYVHNKLVQNLTYEEAMLGVAHNAAQLGIPYRSIQYSVWFKQGKYGGNGEWIADPGLFPDGMQFMYEQTKLPVTAHSRYWSPDTPYAKQNGGDYEFFVEKLRALPYEDRFWTDLFRESQQWGVKTYMQDWLNDQFDNLNATTNNVHVARTWLMQMGMGAERNGISIQYCMSESRHVLQSLEIPAVTQVRASDDYQPDDAKQWRIGMSSMVAWAVGLTPFKDTLWTTEIQPDNYYKKTEPYPAMHVVIATLSTGPVGPGDMINGTNVELLMKCCAADGYILKPSKPAMAIDAQMIQQAFGGSLGPAGELWTTYSDIGSLRFGIIFAVDILNSYALKPSNGHFGERYLAQSNHIYSLDSMGEVTQPRDFTEEAPINVTAACTKGSFCLHYTTPSLHIGEREIQLLGELSKWVPISPNRIVSISSTSDDLVVTLRGAPNEVVDFYSFELDIIQKMSCVVSFAGRARISYAQNQCIDA